MSVTFQQNKNLQQKGIGIISSNTLLLVTQQKGLLLDGGTKMSEHFTNLTQQAEPVVGELLDMDTDKLYEALAIRADVAPQLTLNSHTFSFATSKTVPTLATPMSASDAASAGKKFFDRLSTSAYAVVCGSGPEHNQIVSVLDQGQKAVAVAIAAALVSGLGLVAGIAAIVATIIVKLFFDAAGQTICDEWKKNLPISM